ncbi:hypothetical protein AABB24_015750, partial [Solanum stoloniferum]
IPSPKTIFTLLIPLSKPAPPPPIFLFSDNADEAERSHQLNQPERALLSSLPLFFLSPVIPLSSSPSPLLSSLLAAIAAMKTTSRQGEQQHRRDQQSLAASTSLPSFSDETSCSDQRPEAEGNRSGQQLSNSSRRGKQAAAPVRTTSAGANNDQQQQREAARQK